MTDAFFEAPVLNSPYDFPGRHWELDEAQQPTDHIIEQRRPASYVTPIAQPKKQGGKSQQAPLVMGDSEGISSDEQEYDPTSTINVVRQFVDNWRQVARGGMGCHARDREAAEALAASSVQRIATILLPGRSGRDGDLADGGCARSAEDEPTTAGARPAYCAQRAGQCRAAAVGAEARHRRRQDHRYGDVDRLANGQRRASARRAATSPSGFLVVSPGITIRDRLRVLLPNDPDSYYQSRELVPSDMLADLKRARIVITNYHAFKQRETLDLAKGSRALLQAVVAGDSVDGDRGPDDAARDARADGHAQHHGLQRRGAPLLPREAGRERRGQAHRRRPPGGEQESRGGPPLDLWSRSRPAQTRHPTCHRSLGDAVLSARIGISRGHTVPLDDVRLLADGRNRVRDRQACRASPSPTISPALRFRCSANCGNTYAAICPRRAEASPAHSIRSASRPSCRPLCRPCMDITRRPFASGRRPALRSRRASSWSATTPRPRSWSTTTSQDSIATTRMARPGSRMVNWSCSVTTTTTEITTLVRARC